MYCGTCKSDPCLVFRYDGVEPICCHDMVRFGHCQHEPLVEPDTLKRAWDIYKHGGDDIPPLTMPPPNKLK